jgi:hypothetical protein
LLDIPGKAPSPVPLRVPAVLAAGAPRDVPREACEVRRGAADFFVRRPLALAEPFFFDDF